MDASDVIEMVMAGLVIWVFLVVAADLLPQILDTAFGREVIQGAIQFVFFFLIGVVIVLGLQAVIGD
ncbi:hypothetical protein [Halorubrum tebenquichense]|uniref:hypothetical protein n=1 Tax=Halorubrum tebenquichense TaxID=119434 RepID=UPI0012686370|nr:hypothetical protein [Halorubrum tebenquichense]